MAKLTRVFLRGFASTALGAVNGLEKFGSFAAGGAVYTTDPAAIQSLGAWLSGWASAIEGGGDPVLEDWNAVCRVFSYMLEYLHQAGVPEWEAQTTYFIGSMVESGDEIFVSLTDTNLNNAVTDTAHWHRYGSKITQYAADHVFDGTEQVAEFDATLADRAATLPAASAALKGKRFTITKTDASAHLVTISDGTLVLRLAAQFDSETVLCNGAIWYPI